MTGGCHRSLSRPILRCNGFSRSLTPSTSPLRRLLIEWIFMPVVIDLRPSMKVTIPWGKPVQRLIFTHISGHRKPRSVVFRARTQSEGRCSCKKDVGKDENASPWSRLSERMQATGTEGTLRNAPPIVAPTFGKPCQNMSTSGNNQAIRLLAKNEPKNEKTLQFTRKNRVFDRGGRRDSNPRHSEPQSDALTN